MASSHLAVSIERIPKHLGGKVPEASPLLDLLCSACSLPLVEPQQTSDCGCRLCVQCYSVLSESGQTSYICGKCGYNVSVEQTFRDKAIESELKRTSFPCFHTKCPWLGSNLCYRDHISSCKFADVKCHNTGCGAYVAKNDLENHLKSCPYKTITCRWCGESIPVKRKQYHEENDCQEYTVVCPAGCEEKFPRKMTGEHLQNDCRKQIRQCLYTRHGCTFKGTYDQLNQHYHSYAWKHTELLEKAVSNSEKQVSPNYSLELQRKCQDNDQKLMSIRTELMSLREEMNRRLNPLSEGLVKMEAVLQDFQDSFQELSLLVQTLQATSYNGEFVWKIPEVARRRDEAVTGKTISLYSAPFYTSRFGYKLCLRLYMDGDGSGKGVSRLPPSYHSPSPPTTGGKPHPHEPPPYMLPTEHSVLRDSRGTTPLRSDPSFGEEDTYPIPPHQHRPLMPSTNQYRDVVGQSIPDGFTHIPQSRGDIPPPPMRRDARKVVHLQRGPSGLGFSIVGGKGSPNGDLPICVKTVSPNSMAGKEGLLKPGDVIMAVNGISFDNYTHQEAVETLKRCTDSIMLTICTP